MTFDFTDLARDPPPSMTVNTADKDMLWLTRVRGEKKFYYREDFVVTHSKDGFSVYRVGPYERPAINTWPRGIIQDKYAVLKNRPLANVMAALGYKTKPTFQPNK